MIPSTARCLAACASAIAAVAAPPPAAAEEAGEATYRQVCGSCHAQGVAGAPRLGDRAAWKARLREGQVELTVDGWRGVRGMPPRGGQPDLPLAAFANATAFMARAAGAAWRDPDAAMLRRIAERAGRRPGARPSGSPAKSG